MIYIWSTGRQFIKKYYELMESLRNKTKRTKQINSKKKKKIRTLFGKKNNKMGETRKNMYSL